MHMAEWDFTTDFLSIGSGGGGLASALAVESKGFDALVVEKRGLIGGSTAMSGGVLWIPNNPLMVEEGVEDSYDEAVAYFEDVVGDIGPASSFERRQAYIRRGPEMVSFLQGLGLEFRRCEGYSDYYPDAKGGKARGRSIEGKVFDGKRLGPWFEKLQSSFLFDMSGLAAYTGDASKLVNFNRSPANLAVSARTWARTKAAGVRGQAPLTSGWSFIGQMLYVALRSEIPVWTSSGVRDILMEDGRAVGAVVQRDGKDLRVLARKGVLIASGGFSHNTEMRKRYLDEAATTDKWSFSNPGDTGEMIELAMSLGAATDLMDEVVWNPCKEISGVPVFDSDRQRPGSIYVDADGKRFVNEASSYLEVCKAQLERNHTTKAVPAWVIFDDDFRGRYAFGKGRPGVIPQGWFDSGDYKKFDSLEELAAGCGIDPAGLRDTVDRFNPNARRGVDPEFHTGEGAYNQYLGDPKWKPNNCLAPIETGPFYASAIYPGDVGTCGGILADEHGRVLKTSGGEIPHLYATGNATASVMGRKYLGAGASIGNSSVFGYLAALHACEN
jgi:3-oxosteroid 1-dehydrogenase